MMPPKQPKITRTLLIRSAIAAAVLLGLVFAFRWWKSRETDPTGDVETSTAGMVAAIEWTGDTKHAVAIKPDGTVIRQSDLPPTSEDRDVTWRPDGNAIFFSSNRAKDMFTMFRWVPDGRAAEQRSIGARSQSAPFFLLADRDQHRDAHALVTAGGTVMDYDPVRPALIQVLPPVNKKDVSVDQEGGGVVSPFEQMYEKFGTSFRSAKWTPDKKAVFAVMRSDLGETLIYQRLEAPTPQEMTPRLVVAGDRIDFDIDQKSGKVFFAVQNFQWLDPGQVPEQFRKGNKITKPYRHALAGLDPSTNSIHVFFASNSDNGCFGSPAVSFDGGGLAFIAGPYTGNGNMTPTSLFVIPTTGTLKALGPPVVTGEIYEPAWSPDGNTLAFARRDSSTSRAIYTMSKGNAPRRLTPASGIFSSPAFSPQAAK